MPTNLYFLTLFSLVAGVNLVVLFLLLFFRKNNTLSNKALGMLIFIPALTLITNSILHSGGFNNHPFLLHLSTSITFLFGPSLILYIHLMEGNFYQFRKHHLFHFGPILMVLIYGLYLEFQEYEVIKNNYLRIMAGEDWITNFIYLFQLLHFGIYIIWGVRKIKKYKSKIKDNLTTFEGVNYNWLWFFVTRLLLLNLILIVVYVVQISFFPNYTIYSELLATPLAASCFYPLVVYKSLSNHLVFDKNTFKELVNKNKSIFNTESNLKGIKEESETENFDRLKAIKLELDKHLVEKKVFTTPQLSIQKLADEIGCGKTILSQTINRLYGTTFFDLVNNHRVEEAKTLLLDSNYFHLKIDSIGEMAGFSSRTSFFSVFKKTTNLSPAQYRELKEN